jgi:peptide-methionine (R)-S-oxide reductase
MLTWDNLKPEEKSPVREDKLVLTDAEWKARLTAEQYRILRSHGTDPAFCGLMENQTEEGDYHCAGCELPLFVSSNKFISKSGWPSFYIPVKRENIWMRTDSSYGMVRVEVLCSKCDGHLGHVFPDGPAPSGLRFCINGSALNFKKAKD